MLKYRDVIAIIVMSTYYLSALELPQSVKLRSDGSFQIGEAEFCIRNVCAGVVSQNKNWRKVKVKSSRKGMELSAIMSVGKSNADITEHIIPISNSKFKLDFQAKLSEPTENWASFGRFVLPAKEKTVWVDGKPVQLLANNLKTLIFSKKDAREIRFPIAGGYEVQVSGNPLRIGILDYREFGNNIFVFSFRADDPTRGNKKESKLSLSFQIKHVPIQNVSLAECANMGFEDKVAGDGKGGWTDQGPANDLRQMQPGVIEVGALSFNILDPKKNNSRAVLVLAGKKREFAPSTVSLELPQNSSGAINLLHASAWPPKTGTVLGFMIANYADGFSARIPIVSNIDCGNWWNPTSRSNAIVAWSAINTQVLTGLYASSFALPKPSPISLQFEVATPEVAWMIAGITLSDYPVYFGTGGNKPVVMKENSEWKPLSYRRVIHRGSALDFSFLADAPAGKYGFICPTPQGTLTFEKAPQKQVRLYGVNLCFDASYLTKEAAAQLADYLIYCGYNSLRIHHHDTHLLDRKAPNSLTLNSAQLDKLDYLLYCMKKNGIYVTTDLYCNRIFKSGDNIPECDFYNQRQMKSLLPVSNATMENWKTFVKLWMTHKNPYTGLTWAEDPALWCVNLVNENLFINGWKRFPTSTVKLYEAAFAKYCSERKIPQSVASEKNPDFLRFMYELQDKVHTEQIYFVKKVLGAKTIVTSLNFLNYVPLTLLRQKFDLVDNHTYFDHPSFPDKRWQLPYGYRQSSAINLMALFPRQVMASRLPGKPFIVTEFNYCSPNVYRAECGPLIGGYAALQNWNALYRFAWSHNAKSIYKITGVDGFDAVNDPMAQLSDRIAIAMFRRGDVDSAQEIYAYVVSPECFKRGKPTFPMSFQNLGLITGIGSIPDGYRNVPQYMIELSPSASQNPAALKDTRIAKLWREANEKRIAVSATGQLRLDSNANCFIVTTSRTESITLPSGSLAARTLRVKNASCFQTVAAISLDENPLTESKSILIIQLTNIANTNQCFADESRQIMTRRGELPLLIRKGSATIELVSSRPWRITALNCDGEAYGEVKGTYQNGIFSFIANTTQFSGGGMAYHLTR